MTLGAETDTEKLSSSLAVLAEVFEKVAESSRKDDHGFLIILAEYRLKW